MTKTGRAKAKALAKMNAKAKAQAKAKAVKQLDASHKHLSGEKRR